MYILVLKFVLIGVLLAVEPPVSPQPKKILAVDFSVSVHFGCGHIKSKNGCGICTDSENGINWCH